MSEIDTPNPAGPGNEQFADHTREEYKNDEVVNSSAPPSDASTHVRSSASVNRWEDSAEAICMRLIDDSSSDLGQRSPSFPGNE
jgi:hypothetical protein